MPTLTTSENPLGSTFNICLDWSLIISHLSHCPGPSHHHHLPGILQRPPNCSPCFSLWPFLQFSLSRTANDSICAKTLPKTPISLIVKAKPLHGLHRLEVFTFLTWFCLQLLWIQFVRPVLTSQFLLFLFSFFQSVRPVLTSGHLHWLFPLTVMLFPQIAACINASLLPSLCSNIIFLTRPNHCA